MAHDVRSDRASPPSKLRFKFELDEYEDEECPGPLGKVSFARAARHVLYQLAGGPHDDGSGEPKRPGMSGYNAPSECTENLCEEGMHIGGFYQSGGRVGHKGYTGHFFDGVIDEVRVWQRPRTVVEINMFMAVPLRPSDFTAPDKGLLFYFPFDERGVDSGQEMIVVESRAYPWFGLLGNSTGAGRPVWVESEAPLKCMVDSLARPCIEVGMGNTREENYAVAPGSATGVAALASGLKRRYSHGTPVGSARSERGR